jgi:hypothetical protein
MGGWLPDKAGQGPAVREQCSLVDVGHPLNQCRSIDLDRKEVRFIGDRSVPGPYDQFVSQDQNADV